MKTLDQRCMSIVEGIILFQDNYNIINGMRHEGLIFKKNKSHQDIRKAMVKGNKEGYFKYEHTLKMCSLYLSKVLILKEDTQ